MLQELKKLCSLPGVSGREDAVRDYILSVCRENCAEVKTDAMGNVLAFKKGAKAPREPIMLAAHMDEVGVIITNITDDGFLKFDFVGGIDRRVVLGKKVYIGDSLIPGVIGMKAFHLADKSEEDRIMKLKEMYIDIGAENKEEAASLVSLGDVGSFDGECVEFGESFIKAKAIDDRIGCCVMLTLMREVLPVDTWFAFTVQEEVGCRGANTAAYAIKPGVALILEGTTAADIPSQKGGEKVCIAGAGPVIPFMDGGAVYDRALFNELRELAEADSIPWQTKTLISGGTDAQAIQRSRAGVRTAAISAAVRYIHSPSSVACVKDFDSIIKLAQLFLRKRAEEA